jgi:hypothetical protein
MCDIYWHRKQVYYKLTAPIFSLKKILPPVSVVACGHPQGAIGCNRKL